MIHPIKIEFKDYPSGNWTDWSDYLATPPSINRKVESENDGEAGLIVFDTASVEFYYTPGSPVHTAFETDLTNKQRYLFRISFYTGSAYEQLFEGMADFTSIDEPELSNVITLDIVDKLSAIGILEASSLREKNIDVFARSGADGIATILHMYQPNSSGVDYMVFRMWDHTAGDQGRFINFTETGILQLGEIFTITEDDKEKLALVISSPEVIPEVAIDVAPPYTQYNFNSVRVKVIVSESFNYGGTSVFYQYSGSKLIYDKLMLGVDINIISGSTLQAYDGEKIIEAIVKQQWSDITFVNRTSAGAFSIPLNYFTQTTGELPFNKEPLDALKMLADSMKCYIFFNRTGELVIQSKDDLGTNGTTRSIGSTRKIDANKKRFWDKLIDAAEVKVKSWVQVGGEFLEGYSLQTKAAPGSSSYIKPKNKLTKELFASSSSIDTQAELDSEAASEASEYLDFYGKRRSAVDLILELDNNVLLWDLLDNITYNSIDYFFTSLDLDLVEKEASLELVEVNGHDYDLRSVVIPLSENQQSAISSGGATSGGGTTFAGYTFNEPLSKLGVLVDLNYTDNLKVTAGELDTIQPIKTSSAPTFASMNLQSGSAYFQLVPNDVIEYVNNEDNTVWSITDLDSPGDESFKFYGGGDVANVFSVDNTGKVGIRVVNPSEALDVAGKIAITTDSSFGIGEESKIFNMSTNGLTFQVGSGTVNDFSLASSNGTIILRNPMGTNDISVYGEFNAQNIQTSNYDQSTPQFTQIHSRALLLATEIEACTAVGYNAGYSNNGIRATFLGHYAGCSPQGTIDAQNYSTALGFYASYGSDGHSITSIGYKAGQSAKGSNNVYIGNQAGDGADNTSHSTNGDNLFLGTSAGRYATSYRSIFLGHAAGYQANLTYSISIGYAAGQYADEANGVFIGYYAGHGQTGASNIYIGYQTYGVSKNTNYNTLIGYRAGYSFNVTETDSHLTGIGTYALREASRYIQTGIGFYAGYKSSSGLSIFIGASSGYLSNANTNSAYQNAIGYQSLREATGTHIEALGGYAGYKSTSIHSTYIGYYSGGNSTGDRVVGIGYEAGNGGTGSDSIYFGYQAGKSNSTARVFQIKHNQSTALMTGDFNSNSIGFNTNVSPTDGRLQFNELHLEQVGNKSYYNNFTSGWTGSGFRLDYGITNTNMATLELDDLWVRGTMHVYEFVINQIRATNGSLFVSSAGRVESVTSSSAPNEVVVIEDAEGHGVTPFAVGDLILVQRVKLDSTSIVKRLVRVIKTIVGTTISFQAASGAPTDSGTFEVGDVIVRFGHGSDTNRQGSLYLTSDDSNAPYMDVIDDVTSWADWKDSSKLKVRLGKLTGISTSNFGTLSDYGLFTRRLYLESGSSSGIAMKVDADTAYFAMTQGSNTVFDFDTASATAHLAGWDVDHLKVGKTFSSFNHVGMYSAGYFYAGYGYAPFDDDTGVMMGLIPSGQPNSGSIGIQARDNYGLKTYFTLTNNIRRISAWDFDDIKLHNGDVRIEASTSFKGLGIKNGADTVVKVGDFTNAAESYFTTAQSLPSTTWAQERISHGSSYNITNASNTVSFTPNTSGVYTQVSIEYSKTLPINDIKGKAIKVQIGSLQEDGAQVAVTGMIKVDGKDIDMKDMSTLVGSDDTYTFYANIPADAVSAKFYFYYFYNSGSTNPAAVYVDFDSIHTYEKSVTELNKDGMKIYSSPITSVNLTKSRADFNVAALKTTDTLQIGNFRFYTKIGLNGDGSTYQQLILQFFNGTSWTDEGKFNENGTYSSI